MPCNINVKCIPFEKRCYKKNLKACVFIKTATKCRECTLMYELKHACVIVT